MDNQSTIQASTNDNANTHPVELNQAYIQALLEIADDHLILGHRLSELCGHAPILEEDLSIPNMALDLLGQAQALYSYLAELDGNGKSEDDFAYLRGEREYRNCLLVEQPNTDFAHTILKQFYFSSYMSLYWSAHEGSTDTTLKGIANKAQKEMAYHVRHCGEWIIRLGDGTPVSAERMQDAAEQLQPYCDELFTPSAALMNCVEADLLANPQSVKADWLALLNRTFEQATLTVPNTPYPQQGGRSGVHTELFGHLLSELQYLQRTYPNNEW